MLAAPRRSPPPRAPRFWAPLQSVCSAGGHPRLAPRLASGWRRFFKVDLSMRSLFDPPPGAALAATIGGLLRSSVRHLPPPIVRVVRDGPLPTSFSQRRLWFLNQLDPD